MKTNAAGQAESIFVASFPRSVRVLRALAVLTLHPGPLPVRGAGLSAHLPLLDTAGLAGMAGKVRNPKSETISNEQRSKPSKQSRRKRANWSGFENLSFEFRACFGFRVSDFGFVFAGQRFPRLEILAAACLWAFP